MFPILLTKSFLKRNRPASKSSLVLPIFVTCTPLGLDRSEKTEVEWPKYLALLHLLSNVL